MRCLKRNNNEGNSVVEFVLILPWLIACLLALITVARWIMIGHLLHYTAYKGARALSVYEEEGAKIEMEEIAPKMNTLGFMPAVSFALEGETRDLSSQEKQMDNPIGFCGDKGEYGLCAH